jgi:hypothetical protein
LRFHKWGLGGLRQGFNRLEAYVRTSGLKTAVRLTRIQRFGHARPHRIPEWLIPKERFALESIMSKGAGSFLSLIAFVHGSRTNAPWAKNLKVCECFNADLFQAIKQIMDMLYAKALEFCVICESGHLGQRHAKTQKFSKSAHRHGAIRNFRAFGPQAFGIRASCRQGRLRLAQRLGLGPLCNGCFRYLIAYPKTPKRMIFSI